jgi:iron complex transport system permease protein
MALTAVASLFLALMTGSTPLGLAAILSLPGGHADELTNTLIMDIRLPRALAAFTTGGMLALAGCLMQVLLRNPLADPYILGISGGAAVGALLALAAGAGGLWVDGSAFAGALGITLLVFIIARGRGGWTPIRLLLVGVVIASGMGALISLILALGPDSSLRGMLFWLMGDFSFARQWSGQMVVLVVALMISMSLARPLNLLTRGEKQATVLGVEVGPLRTVIYLLGSLLTAAAVTTAGSIGFVGLVIPHLVRLIAGSDHRIVLPASVLLGGSLLVVADTLARTVVAPRQLPVGALTALIGVPLFLVLLNSRRSL